MSNKKDKNINALQDCTIKQEIVRPNKHNYKLTKEDEYNIVLEYSLNKNKRSIEAMCSKYGITSQTIYNVVKKHRDKKDEIVQKCIAETRNNFSKRTTQIIKKALDKIEDKLEQGEDVNLSQLATLTGILYDKESLELGKSTSNQSFNVNIKIDK